MQARYDWCARLTSVTLICWQVNEREEGQINFCKFAGNWSPTFFVEIVGGATTASPCVKTTRPHASSANSFRPDLSGRFKWEMVKPKWLFVKLNIILPWSGARREEEIQFSLFVHSCLLFFGWQFYMEPKTSKTRETKWNAHFVNSRTFEKWYCWMLLVFSQSQRNCKVGCEIP